MNDINHNENKEDQLLERSSLYEKEEKKGSFFYKLIKLLILISIISGFLIYKGYSDFTKTNIVKTDLIIKINEGEIPSNLSEKFDLNKYYLKLYLKNHNPDYELIAGKFKIEKNSSIDQVLKQLQNPIIEGEISITIFEGWNIFDIDNYLSNQALINKGEYISYVNSSEKIEKLTEFFPFIKGLETLEGYLYPDTYKINSESFKINQFTIKQLENFENKVYNELLKNIDNKKIEGIIKMASIVEKEEKNSDEKSTVAGILKKRLENGWMIGADITVCYPHQLTSEECKMVVTKYINEKNEYNTRTMQGLPKTPIGNPSFETINSTINSKKSKYWFYLHDISTGKIYYGKDNSEHEKNKNLYLK